MLEDFRGCGGFHLGDELQWGRNHVLPPSHVSVWGRRAEQLRQIQALHVDSLKPNTVRHGPTGWTCAQPFPGQRPALLRKEWACRTPAQVIRWPEHLTDSGMGEAASGLLVPVWKVGLSFTSTSRSERGPLGVHTTMIDCFWALGSSLPSYPSSSASTE